MSIMNHGHLIFHDSFASASLSLSLSSLHQHQHLYLHRSSTQTGGLVTPPPALPHAPYSLGLGAADLSLQSPDLETLVKAAMTRNARELISSSRKKEATALLRLTQRIDAEGMERIFNLYSERLTNTSVTQRTSSHLEMRSRF